MRKRTRANRVSQAPLYCDASQIVCQTCGALLDVLNKGGSLFYRQAMRPDQTKAAGELHDPLACARFHARAEEVRILLQRACPPRYAPPPAPADTRSATLYDLHRGQEDAEATPEQQGPEEPPHPLPSGLPPL